MARMAPYFSRALASSGGGGDPPTSYEWQQLTVASHSRKVISTTSPGDSATYSATATGAQSDVEALSPQTVQSIPLVGYNIMVQGEPGVFYISGSLHSGYRGCEINRLVMPTDASTEIAITISHQPTAPPIGPNSGYASGLGGYIYKQSYAAESIVGMGDQTAALDWKPFIGHDWTMSTWTSTTGFATMVAHAVQTGQSPGDYYHEGAFSIVSDVLQSSHTQPSDDYTSGTRKVGLVGFDFGTGKFKTWLSQLSAEISSLPSGGYPFSDTAYGLGTSGLSDFNDNDGTLLFFNSASSGYMNVLKWHVASNVVTVLASLMGSGATAPISVLGGDKGHSENGWLIRHLENNEFLMLRQNLLGRSGIGIFTFSEDYGSGDSRVIDLTSSLPGGGSGEPFEGSGSSSDPLSFCVDKVGRRVFWIVTHTGAAPTFYVSSFDSLMTWTEISTTGLSAWANAGGWITLNRQPMHYHAGWLFLQDNATGPNAPSPNYHSGTMNLKRCYVGEA